MCGGDGDIGPREGDVAATPAMTDQTLLPADVQQALDLLRGLNGWLIGWPDTLQAADLLEAQTRARLAAEQAQIRIQAVADLYERQYREDILPKLKAAEQEVAELVPTLDLCRSELKHHIDLVSAAEQARDEALRQEKWYHARYEATLANWNE
jgi:hypothetical protein